MLIGYRRISPDDQTLDLQTDALNQAGCDRIFMDITTEPGAEQPGLDEAAAYARPGDVLVVWRIERVGKPLKQLFEWMIDLHDRGISFKSLEENLDTQTYDPSEMLRVLRVFVESEQQVLTEKTRIGLKRAKTRGRKGGRKRSLTPQQIRIGRTLAADPTQTVKDICRSLKISESTYYRYIHPKQSLE
ncbi:MAG: recombinase family protein [Leptolyngbya sp. Prado105]|jgi:DNA invertase Pin-like site-specific DNA recombinase|nr:recombinase family protein [Leptolyngbya sp. Prado105]